MDPRVKDQQEINAKAKNKGKYKESVYYSKNLPEVEGGDPALYDKETYELMEQVLRYPKQTGEEMESFVGGVQQKLASIGYYDGDIDSVRGPMTLGAARRYTLEFSDQAFIEKAREWVPGYDSFMDWWKGEDEEKK